MAEKDPEKRPIIIKKVKKAAHGHHGGAWKVAYADFVTAMMAFFLLLWLLSSSSKETLQGISEYFTPTVGVKDSQGIGTQGGQTVAPGKVKSAMTSPGVVTGQSPAGETPDSPETQASASASEDGSLMSQAQNDIKKIVDSDPNMREFVDNILVEQSPEGLKIEVMDSDKHPLYQRGNAALTPDGEKILTAMLPVIQKMPNFISITGHTDSSSETGGRADYNNWNLSSDRAIAAQRFLLKSGMDKERTKKIVAMADKELIDENDPRNAKNRRVTLILLRDSHMNLGNKYLPAERDLLSVKPVETPAPKKPAMPKAKGAAPESGGMLVP